jgi:hypothetical protein
MLNMESRADCKGNSRDCKYKKKTYTHMSPVAVYMWKSETLTAGDIVCLELATVLECLDSAFAQSWARNSLKALFMSVPDNWQKEPETNNPQCPEHTPLEPALPPVKYELPGWI